MKKIVDLCANGKFSDFLSTAKEEIKNRITSREDVSQRISEIRRYREVIKNSNPVSVEKKGE
jgi:hypothetical protein